MGGNGCGRAHRHVDPHATAGLDTEIDECLGELRHGTRELRPGERRAGSVLAEENRGFVLGAVAHPFVDAVPSDVQLAADEPRRPLDAARGVDDALPRGEELEAEVVDHLGPKAVRSVDGDSVEVGVALDAQPLHQPRDVRAVSELRRRRPDELGHCVRLFDEPC